MLLLLAFCREGGTMMVLQSEDFLHVLLPISP